MKFVPLIWMGIWRKRSRAILILLQIVVAFTLFGVLQGLSSGVRQAIERTHADRIWVGSRVSLGDPLPMALLARIQAVPGVELVTYRVVFPGMYQKPDQPVRGVATNPESGIAVSEAAAGPNTSCEA